MFDRARRTSRCRCGIIVVPAVVGMLATRPMLAQGTDAAVSGAITLTQPLTSHSPGDVAGYVMVDPSRRAFAPWASAGLRWDGFLARGAYPIANVGLRLRSRSLRVAFGISRDVVYGSLGRSQAPDNMQNTPLDSLGVTIPLGGSDPTTGIAGDTGNASARTAYAMRAVTDLVGTLDWSVGRLTIGSQSGWRLAGPARGRPWYSATIATPLVQNFALVAGVDRRYDRVFLPGNTRLTLGMQWRSAPWAHRRSASKPRQRSNDSTDHLARKRDGNVAIVRVPNGIRITVAASGATRVEIRSDVTGWVAVPLERNAEGAWQLDLEAEPGVHRLTLRIDGGAWLPPPGLPVGSDGYGAEVGLLIVES